MKINRNTVIWGVFAALQLVSTYSFALTLGRVRGGALLGKELDLSVQVQFSAEEDMSAACFDADLSYGDTPLERSRFTVTTQLGQQPNTQIVRVYSSTRVDEALVTLNLKAACGPKASRRYVLLPDVASELAGVGVTYPGAALAGKVNPAVPDASKAAAPDVAANAAIAGATAKSSPVAKPASVRRAVPADKKLASVSPAAEADTRSRVQVSASVIEDLQKRVDDIAKWQAENGSTEESLKTDARAKALEAGIRDLQAVTAKNQQSLQLVAAAVEGTASQNYGRTLLYLMGALLLLSLAALVYVVKRVRSGGDDTSPWWSAGDDREEVAAVLEKRPVPQSVIQATPTIAEPVSKRSSADTLAQPAPVVAPAGAPQLDSDENSGFDSFATAVQQKSVEFPKIKVPVPAPLVSKTAKGDSTPSGHGTLRAVNTREMLDVRQQADFFMALGQHDEAVRMLESNITGSSDANPLVYLDLLKILHTLSRRTDFERYREEFNFQFTGRIPSYADFLQEGNGIEAYEEICHQIMVLWPTEYTIDFIEQCLVRTPEDDPEQGMDLEAFKDLLLLYGVLKRLDQFYDSSLAPFSASRPAIETAGSVHAVLDTQVAVPLPTVPAAMAIRPESEVGTDVDLDIDLDFGGEKPDLSKPANLIDFDVSDYTAIGKPNADKK